MAAVVWGLGQDSFATCNSLTTTHSSHCSLISFTFPALSYPYTGYTGGERLVGTKIRKLCVRLGGWIALGFIKKRSELKDLTLS